MPPLVLPSHMAHSFIVSVERAYSGANLRFGHKEQLRNRSSGRATWPFLNIKPKPHVLKEFFAPKPKIRAKFCDRNPLESFIPLFETSPSPNSRATAATVARHQSR